MPSSFLNALDNGITPKNSPDKNYENFLKLSRQVERLQLYFPAQDAPYQFDNALRLKSYTELTGDGEASELVNVTKETRAQHSNNVLLLGNLGSPDPVRLQLLGAFEKIPVSQGFQSLQLQQKCQVGDGLIFISDEFIKDMQGDKLFPVDPEFFEVGFIKAVDGNSVTLTHPISRTCNNCLVANITQTKVEKPRYPGLDTNPIELVQGVGVSKLKLVCASPDGVPLHPMGINDCLFSDLWLHGDSLIYGNAMSHSTFQNIQGTFNDKVVDIALGSTNLIVKNLRAVASGINIAKPKRIVNIGQASRDVVIDGVEIDARAREGVALFGVGADNILIKNARAVGGHYPSAIVSPSTACPSTATFENCDLVLQGDGLLITAVDRGEKHLSDTTLKNCRFTLRDAAEVGAMDSISQPEQTRPDRPERMDRVRDPARANQQNEARGVGPNRPGQRGNRERPVDRERPMNRRMQRMGGVREPGVVEAPDAGSLLESTGNENGNTRVTGRNKVSIV